MLLLQIVAVGDDDGGVGPLDAVIRTERLLIEVRPLIPANEHLCGGRFGRPDAAVAAPGSPIGYAGTLHREIGVHVGRGR